jgi:hypothetical protein
MHGLINSKEKGRRQEIEISRQLQRHDHWHPILVPANLLRKKGMGQIDLAFYDSRRQIIIVYEIKSSGRLTHTQKKRIFESSKYLAQIFDRVVQCELVVVSDLPKPPTMIKLF